MYKQKLENDLKAAVRSLSFKADDIVVSIPENEQFGDYTSNIALQLSKQKSKNPYHSPREIANAILEKLGLPPYLEQTELAGPGFINFYLKDQSLLQIINDEIISSNVKMKQCSNEAKSTLRDKRVLVEYADPNTHKALHIGHVRTLTLGESVARIFEHAGARVFRANYGSDIGPTVAKALFGISLLMDEFEKVKKEGTLKEKALFLAKAYVKGHAEYSQNPGSKTKIDELTKKLYLNDPEITPLWEETKKWSLGYFDTIYSRFGTEFDRVIGESEVTKTGKQIVELHTGKVFIKDQGAVIFPGEKYGLHNRVFITSVGHPTYEGKELGLMQKYQEIFPFNLAIILSHNEQIGFHQVVIKANELIDQTLIGKKKHLSYGEVSLTTGKMSSRTGNVVLAEDLMDEITSQIKALFPGKIGPSHAQTIEKVMIGAIKFAILKYANNTDIKFDIKSSVSLDGDSGPYVMYTYARTCSLLAKSHHSGTNSSDFKTTKLEPEERSILRNLEHFDTFLLKSLEELAPNHIAIFLLHLAKSFNNFYQKHAILGSKKEEFRLALTQKVGETLRVGLDLLGIEAVERM